jgi:ethanolamine utilization protein EutQ
VLKILMDKGLLNGANPEDCPPAKGPVKPYSYQQDPSGMKLIDGATIQYDPLKTDDPANQVSYQEIINADDGCRMNAGMISIERCKFGWKTESQEIYHVVEGTLKVTAGNKEYTAKAGDTVFFPEGVQVTFGSPDKMKAFYAAY